MLSGKRSCLPLQVIPNVSDWWSASTYCQAAGAQLLSIHSQTENDYFASQLFSSLDISAVAQGGSAMQSCNADSSTVIGAYSPLGNNVYNWTDGSPMDFTNWEPGDPNRPESVRLLPWETVLFSINVWSS